MLTVSVFVIALPSVWDLLSDVPADKALDLLLVSVELRDSESVFVIPSDELSLKVKSLFRNGTSLEYKSSYSARISESWSAPRILAMKTAENAVPCIVLIIFSMPWI